MVSVSQNIVGITVAVLISLAAMEVLNRIWPRERRRQYNDLIGWQLSVLSTTYAVILGFMLYSVWTTYDQAELNVDVEANAVLNLFRVAGGLPEPQRTQVRAAARAYATAVIDQEWPEMARGEVPNSSQLIREMWDSVTSARTASPSEVNAQEHAMNQLESLTQHRLTRLVESRRELPTVLWCVLLMGGALTIFSACMFATHSAKLHAVQVICFSLLVSLSLVAIADIHRPFHGLIHVSDYAFERAKESMSGN